MNAPRFVHRGRQHRGGRSASASAFADLVEPTSGRLPHASVGPCLRSQQCRGRGEEAGHRRSARYCGPRCSSEPTPITDPGTPRFGGGRVPLWQSPSTGRDTTWGEEKRRPERGSTKPRALVDESPKDVPRRLSLAGFLLCVGRDDDAWEEAQCALQTGTVTTPVHVAFAYRSAVRAGDWKGARGVLRRASWAGRALAVLKAHRWVRASFLIAWALLTSLGLLLSSVVLELAAGALLVGGATLTGWALGWSTFQTASLTADFLLVQAAAYVIFVGGDYLVGAALLVASVVVGRWMPGRKGRAQPTPVLTG